MMIKIVKKTPIFAALVGLAFGLPAVSAQARVSLLDLQNQISELQTQNQWESYASDVFCESSGSNRALCYFDIPPGKVLEVQRVSGFTRLGAVTSVSLQTRANTGAPVITGYTIPTTTSQGVNHFFSAMDRFFGIDSDWATDANGNSRDFRIIIDTTGSGSSTGTRCTVIGRLYNLVP